MNSPYTTRRTWKWLFGAAFLWQHWTTFIVKLRRQSVLPLSNIPIRRHG